MQLIHCPWCGPREEVEFHYGGQADLPYPQSPADLSDREWAEFVFYRDNDKGPFPERWCHSTGCRRWFNAVRDTRTYEFLAIYRVGEPVPGVAGVESTKPEVRA
ncbi:sarcosine oxidase subunit delta [Saccharopolyspora sp. NPDC049426]|uniref:sarcosine oxidase subunit delta n=1 Tax=Saccharopolyspora sp. NPDC049426 TaxID=3155652 RepID=UPI003443226B